MHEIDPVYEQPWNVEFGAAALQVVETDDSDILVVPLESDRETGTDEARPANDEISTSHGSPEHGGANSSRFRG